MYEPRPPTFWWALLSRHSSATSWCLVLDILHSTFSSFYFTNLTWKVRFTLMLHCFITDFDEPHIISSSHSSIIWFDTCIKIIPIILLVWNIQHQYCHNMRLKRLLILLKWFQSIFILRLSENRTIGQLNISNIWSDACVDSNLLKNNFKPWPQTLSAQTLYNPIP